jgi:hypothetical protein
MVDFRYWKPIILVLAGLRVVAVTPDEKSLPINGVLKPVTEQQVYPNSHQSTSPSSLKRKPKRKLKSKLMFAGERVPLENPRVAARFKRELEGHQILQYNTNTRKEIKRALPRIERILKAKGIPSDFKYLAVVESFMRNDTSASGAVGVWQLMPETARELGLTVNERVDERHHLDKATRAACRYLIDAKSRLGSWTVTAAAYNRGIGAVERAIEEQNTQSFYRMRFRQQTSRYIYRVLAVKHILEQPAQEFRQVWKTSNRGAAPKPVTASL